MDSFIVLFFRCLLSQKVVKMTITAECQSHTVSSGSGEGLKWGKKKTEVEKWHGWVWEDRGSKACVCLRKEVEMNTGDRENERTKMTYSKLECVRTRVRLRQRDKTGERWEWRKGKGQCVDRVFWRIYERSWDSSVASGSLRLCRLKESAKKTNISTFQNIPSGLWCSSNQNWFGWIPYSETEKM